MDWPHKYLKDKRKNEISKKLKNLNTNVKKRKSDARFGILMLFDSLQLRMTGDGGGGYTTKDKARITPQT